MRGCRKRPGMTVLMPRPHDRDRVIEVQRAGDMQTGEDDRTTTRACVCDVPIHPHLRLLIDATRSTGRVFPDGRRTHGRDVERGPVSSGRA